MKAFKTVLDHYCHHIPAEFKDALALHKSSLKNAPLTASFVIGENENPVLFWQLLLIFLEWHSSGEPNIQELHELLFKMSQLDQTQCKTLLVNPAMIAEQQLKTSIVDVLWVLYLYIEFTEMDIDIVAPSAEFMATSPEYFKLIAFMRALSLVPSEEELVHYLRTRIEQDLIEPSLWSTAHYGVFEDLTPLYLFIHSLSRNSNTLIPVGEMIAQKVEPSVWVSKASTGETPLCHMMKILRCIPDSKGIITLAGMITNKIDPQAWLIETTVEEESTSSIFELISVSIDNPENEEIKTLLDAVLTRVNQTEEGAVTANLYRNYILLRKLLITLAAYPENKDILARTRAEILLIEPSAWLVEGPMGITPVYLLCTLLLQYYDNEEIICLALNVVEQVHPGGWEIIVRHDALKAHTPIYKLMEVFYHNPQSKNLQELVLKAVQQTDAPAWAAASFENETALHLLTTILWQQKQKQIVSIVKEVIPRTNPGTWGLSHIAKNKVETTPLNQLMAAFNRNPTNEELLDLVEMLSMHADIPAWSFVIPKKFTPLHQLLGGMLYNTNPRLIHISKKLIERITPAIWELHPSDDEGFTILSLIMLILVYQPQNNTIIAMSKMAIKNALPSVWDIPITQGAGVVWDTPLRVIMRALSQNSQNKDIIEMANTVAHRVNPILWREKNLSNNSALYEVMRTLVNNPLNEQIIDIAKMAIENAKPEDWGVAILSEAHSRELHKRTLSLLASIMPGSFIKLANDAPGSTPLCALTCALAKNPKNEELIKLVEKVLKQIHFKDCTTVALAGIGSGKSTLHRLLNALAHNPHHPILINCTSAILKSKGYTPGPCEIPLLIAALTPWNIHYFIKTLITLKIHLPEIASLNPILFTGICSRVLNALAHPTSTGENEKTVLDFVQASSVHNDIWQFLIDESIIEQASKIKTRKDKNIVTFLSRLLLLLEKPDLIKDSQKRVITLLKNSTHPIGIDSWKSLEKGSSSEFQQLERLIGNCTDLELKKQLEDLRGSIRKKIAPETSAIMIKSKKSGPTLEAASTTGNLTKEKALWDLVTIMLEQPSKKNGTALVNYSSMKRWGETHIVTHSQVNNSWTPWLLLIIYSLDNKVAYDQQKMANLLETMGGLVTALPESAWATPLLNNGHIVEYPMHALITIYKGVKSKPVERKKSDEELRQLIIHKLKEVIEAAIKHLYTKQKQVLKLVVVYGSVPLDVYELLFNILPEFKKSNSPIFHKLFSEYQEQTLPAHSMSFFPSKGVGQVQNTSSKEPERGVTHSVPQC